MGKKTKKDKELRDANAIKKKVESNPISAIFVDTHFNANAPALAYHAAGLGSGKVVWIGAVGAFSRDGGKTPPNELLLTICCPWWLKTRQQSNSER